MLEFILMKWLVFSYSMPAKMSTISRVRIWRKLRKTGAVSPKAGVHVLPYSDECLEIVRWLVAEIEQEQGEALALEVHHFENIPDDKVIDIFRKERASDYQEIEGFVAELEKLVPAEKAKTATNVVSIKRDIHKLKKNIDVVSKIDVFQSYDTKSLLDRLHMFQKTLVTGNRILLIMFSWGTQNNVVLRKMKEERYGITRRESVKIKRAFDKQSV